MDETLALLGPAIRRRCRGTCDRREAIEHGDQALSSAAAWRLVSRALDSRLSRPSVVNTALPGLGGASNRSWLSSTHWALASRNGYRDGPACRNAATDPSQDAGGPDLRSLLVLRIIAGTPH